MSELKGFSFDPSEVSIPKGHFILNKTFLDGVESSVFRASDMQIAGILPEADSEVVNEAVHSAKDAFLGWRNTSPRERAAILFRWADLIQADSENIARVESMVSSRPISESRVRDVAFCVEAIRFYAEWADKIEGSVTASRSGFLNVSLYEPRGVVAAIVPWNFPLILASWKVAPALAAGNTVVLKPSELTPFSALILAELAAKAGLPPGVFNVIHGGASAGAELVSHQLVDYITFTGSSSTGARISETASQRHVEVALELGGKSPQIVFLMLEI